MNQTTAMSGRRGGMLILLVAFLAAAVAVLWHVPDPSPAPLPEPAVDWQKLTVSPELRKPHPLPERIDLDNSTVPGRHIAPYEPGPLAVVTSPGIAPADGGRSIVLNLDRIELLEGAAVVRRVPFDARAEVRLENVVAAVADPDWISRDPAGVVLLRAALVQAQGTHLTISPPGVLEVRLAVLPGVFLAGMGATARIERVHVWSWKLDGTGPDADWTDRRPFIDYEGGSRLDVLSSEVAFLGSDRVSAYGISWRQGGTTGEILDSDFHHNFFGVYTYEARDLVFRGNRFHDNTRYGLNQHDYTTGLVVEDNEAFANGSHGFIFSRGVREGVLRRNYAHDNKGNGIMMHLGSDGNVIVANRVEHNGLDGIVITDSWYEIVADNLVRHNRIGIRSDGESLDNRFAGNRVVDNVTGIQLHEGTRDSILQGNLIRGSKSTALVLAAPGSQVRGGVVEGGFKGVDIRAPASLTGVSIRQVERGLIVGAGVSLATRDLAIEAGQVAVVAERAATVKIAASRLSAPQLSSGTGVQLEAGIAQKKVGVPWLRVAGIVFVAAAITLEVVRRLRNRRNHAGLRVPTLSAG
jgi:parallel beta-helix repeat protein